MTAHNATFSFYAAAHHGGELFEFVPEPSCNDTEDAYPNPWNILVVDDDPEVHESTELALRHAQIQDRPLRFECARTAAQARELIFSGTPCDAILLDIALETHDAGINLIRELRDSSAFAHIKIIVRTGRAIRSSLGTSESRLAIEGFVQKIEQTPQRVIELLSEALAETDQ